MWNMCKWIRKRPRRCKTQCRSGLMCGSLLSLPRGSSPDTDQFKTDNNKKNSTLNQASSVLSFYHYHECCLGLFKTEILRQKKKKSHNQLYACSLWWFLLRCAAGMQDITPCRWGILPPSSSCRLLEKCMGNWKSVWKYHPHCQSTSNFPAHPSATVNLVFPLYLVIHSMTGV